MSEEAVPEECIVVGGEGRPLSALTGVRNGSAVCAIMIPPKTEQLSNTKVGLIIDCDVWEFSTTIFWNVEKDVLDDEEGVVVVGAVVDVGNSSFCASRPVSEDWKAIIWLVDADVPGEEGGVVVGGLLCAEGVELWVLVCSGLVKGGVE
jgi:hypothetical protein